LKAVILAAGEGVRLRPLTDNKPKHLLPLVCKPLLERLIQNVSDCGVRDVLLVVSGKTDAIKRHLGDGKSLGVKLSYATQPAVLGTGHAMGMAREFMRNEPFMALYGDIFLSNDAVKKVVNDYEEGDCQAAMAVTSVSAPQFFGIVTVEGGRVQSIVEKPLTGSSAGNLVNAGLFIFPPEVFAAIDKTGKSERGEFEITQSIKILIDQGVKVKAVELASGSWKDIGRPWDLLEANELALKEIKPSIQGEIEDGARLIGPIVVEKEAVVRSGSYVEGPAYVSAGSEIGPNCYIRLSTSIGRNVKIGNGCEVKNSIVMDDTKIPHLSYIGDSIIGERCNLGAGTIVANLRFDDKPVNMMISGKLVDSGRRKLGVVLGNDVQTGINVSLMPGVKIGSGAVVGPGMTVFRDVPSKGQMIPGQEPDS